MSNTVTAELVERAVALPPATLAVANVFGMPLSDVSSGIMIVYGLMLIAWHLRTKWFAKGGQGAQK